MTSEGNRWTKLGTRQQHCFQQEHSSSGFEGVSFERWWSKTLNWSQTDNLRPEVGHRHKGQDDAYSYLKLQQRKSESLEILCDSKNKRQLLILNIMEQDWVSELKPSSVMKAEAEEWKGWQLMTSFKRFKAVGKWDRRVTPSSTTPYTPGILIPMGTIPLSTHARPRRTKYWLQTT